MCRHGVPMLSRCLMTRLEVGLHAAGVIKQARQAQERCDCSCMRMRVHVPCVLSSCVQPFGELELAASLIANQILKQPTMRAVCLG